MKTQKTILNNESTKKENKKATFEKTLKNSNFINYQSFNKNKQLKENANAFITSVLSEKSNANDANTSRGVKISNDDANNFKTEILKDFTSVLFYNKIKNIDFTNFTIKKIISIALLNNFKTKLTKIDRRQDWAIENLTFESVASVYKFLCDACHRLAVYIDNANKITK